jgi:hypothetical protein
MKFTAGTGVRSVRRALLLSPFAALTLGSADEKEIAGPS